MPLGQVFWHESLHWLKANNPKGGLTTAQYVAKNLGGRLVNGEWIFDNAKAERDFERHLLNQQSNFEGAKFQSLLLKLASKLQ